MSTDRTWQPFVTRRVFLQQSACGFGWLAFSAIAASSARGENFLPERPLAPKRSHFPMKAKRAVFLFMEGGPSQLDTFDWKPQLARAGGRYLPPAFEFKQRGESGLWISEAFPPCCGSDPDAKRANALSLHPGGLLFAFCDGSVDFISETIEASPVTGANWGTRDPLINNFVYRKLYFANDGYPLGSR